MSAQPDHFGFTKLLVVDLDKSAAFYRDVFGLQETARIESDIAGRALDEILFSPTGEGAATFVLLKFRDATVASSSEVIVIPLSASASGMLGVTTSARGSNSLRSAVTASSSRRTSPLFEIITGSTTTSGNCNSAIVAATASTIAAVASIPVFVAAT